MASVTKSPSTMADDASAGTVAWANVDNAKVSDNAYASVTVNGATSHYLKATGFGFSIPSGATINGILIEVEAKTSAATGLTSYQLHKAAGYAGGVQFIAWTSVEAYYSLGGAADLWSTTWTAADINDANFGVGIIGFDAAFNTYSADHVRITVDYTPATPSPPDVSRQDGYRFSPGCCCSPVASGCYIGGDDFDRADNDDLGENWEERRASSGWAILDNTLVTTVTDDLVIYQIPHPDGSPDMIAWADVKSDFAGDQMRVVIAYQDDDNYLFSELEVDTDCGWLRLYQRKAGNTVLLKELVIKGAFLSQWHTLYACFDEDADPYEGSGLFEGRVQTASLEWYTSTDEVTDALGSYAGLATGDVYGNPAFDDFEVWEGQSEEHPECPSCKRGIASCLISIDNFDRPNSPDLGCLWDPKVGSSSWVIQDEELWTLTPYDLVQHLVGHPDGESNLWERVLVNGTDDGDVARLIIAYQDTANYLWVELQVGTCGTMRLFQRLAGVVTQVGSDVPLQTAFEAEWHTLEACYSEGTASEDARLFGKVKTASGETVTHSGEATSIGTYGGLGVGPVYSHVRFNDYAIEKLYSEANPECRLCDDPQDCLIFDDMMYRDELGVGCRWQLVSGTEPDMIEEGKYANNGSAKFTEDAVIMLAIRHPDPWTPSAQFVWVEWWGQITEPLPVGQTVATVRVYVGWLNAANHHYVEVEWIHNVEYDELGQPIPLEEVWFRCYETIGGVTTQVGSSSRTTMFGYQLWNKFFGTVKVCYVPNQVRATSSTMAGADVQAWTITNTTGRQVGFGYESGTDDWVGLDRFRFERGQTTTWENCPACIDEIPCSNCYDNKGPKHLRIALTGVLNYPAQPYEICTVCDKINGSQVVTVNQGQGCMAFPLGWGGVEFDYTKYPTCCWVKTNWLNLNRFTDDIKATVGAAVWRLTNGNWAIVGGVQIECHHSLNIETDYFFLDLGASAPLCDEWYRLEIPWHDCYNPWGGTAGCDVCDFSGSKLLLTAV